MMKKEETEEKGKNNKKGKGKLEVIKERTVGAEKRGGKLGKRKSWERVILLAAWRGGGPTSTSTTTPVLSWKGFVVGAPQNNNTIIKGDPFSIIPPFSSSSFSFLSSKNPQQFFSARKLGAALWEFQYYFSHHQKHPVNTMYLGNHNHRIRRHSHRSLLNNNNNNGGKDEGIEHHHHLHRHHQHPDGSASPDHHPASAGSLRRHIAASLMRHHQSAERNKHALQPLSPASYGSSLEMAPYNPAATPDSSIELRGRIGESSYSFKTSTELLKVLNRIWSLEEQHATNVSLVKALKNELDLARARIKELLRDQQANRHEIDELMKQISEDNLGRKSKEKERIDSALQSMRSELEDERRLRKRSESLHRKLARELFEIKVALSTTVEDLEKQRKSSELLEELCDEFAKGIREYARQVHAVRQKSDKDWSGMAEHDNLVLHISESWLDERMQIKDRETQDKTAERSSVVDKLRHEIEAFLTAQEMAHVRSKDTLSPRDPKESRFRRQSLESIPEAASAPQCVGHEDSAFSDSRCVEISKAGPSNYEEQEELALSGRRKGQTPPSMQMSDPQKTPRKIDAKIMKTGEETPTEISMLQKSEIYDSIQEGNQRKKTYNEEGHGSNSKTVDKLMSELLLSEGGSHPSEYEYKEKVPSAHPALRRHVSPVRQWITSMKSPDPRISESSKKSQPVRDNTLKAKLQEPKSKGQRSRLKILKGSS